MKKTVYIIIIFSLVLFSANAQDQQVTKDTVTLYPESISLYQSNTYISLCGGFKGALGQGNYGLGIDIRPRIGYFFVNKVLVGADILNTYTFDSRSSNQYFLLGGIFSRYYLGKKRSHFFIEAEYHLGNYCNKDNFSDNKLHSLISYGIGGRILLSKKTHGRLHGEIDFKGYSYLDKSECSRFFILGMLGVSYTITGKKAKRALSHFGS